jgi:hypothetical protein
MVLVLFQQQAGEQAFGSPALELQNLPEASMSLSVTMKLNVNPEKAGYHLTGRRLMDKSGSEKILVVESDDSLRESIVTVLSDAG